MRDAVLVEKSLTACLLSPVGDIYMEKESEILMAERRMFSKQIIDSDAFLDMPPSTQALYFHLSMRADDDGFLNNPKKIMRMVGGQQNELEILIGKRFLIAFETGVIVIKHWKMHNYIQKDRYKETQYLTEKAKLIVKDNKSYTEKSKELDTGCVQNVNTLDAQVRLELGKDRLGKKEKVDKSTALPYYSISLSTLIFSHSRTKKTVAQINAGAKIIHDLERIDGYTPEEIKSVIEWALNDSFWSGNVQSPAGLRKKKNGSSDITKFAKIYGQWEKDKTTAIKKRTEFNNVALFPQSYKNGKVCIICDNSQLVNGVKCPCVNYDYVPLEFWDAWMKYYKENKPISYNQYLKEKS